MDSKWPIYRCIFINSTIIKMGKIKIAPSRIFCRNEKLSATLGADCKKCKYYNSLRQHHDCDAKRLDAEHYIDCILVQYGSCYNNVLIKK